MSDPPRPSSAPARWSPVSFAETRRMLDTPSGRIATYESGSGPAALFVHGVPLNSFHWRNVVGGVGDIRRCVAADLMGLGYSEVDDDQDLTFPAQAAMLVQVLDELQIETVDLVGNDSGGAVCQIVAATYPERVRTLTLTNCDTHDGWPPETFGPLHDAAAAGTLAESFRFLLTEPHRAHSPRSFGRAYADPTVLTPEVLDVYLRPLVASDRRAQQLHRYILSMNNQQTVSIEGLLRELTIPTQIVWGLDDVFFDVKWGRWLKATIPGAERLIEVPGARLFFPEDRPDALVEPLRDFWARHAPAS